MMNYISQNASWHLLATCWEAWEYECNRKAKLHLAECRNWSLCLFNAGLCAYYTADSLQRSCRKKSDINIHYKSYSPYKKIPMNSEYIIIVGCFSQQWRSSEGLSEGLNSCCNRKVTGSMLTSCLRGQRHSDTCAHSRMKTSPWRQRSCCVLLSVTKKKKKNLPRDWDFIAAL